jgi:hypothetical protein
MSMREDYRAVRASGDAFATCTDRVVRVLDARGRWKYARAVASSAADVVYDLGQLFEDHPAWFAEETIPHLFAWLGLTRSPLRFQVHLPDGQTAKLTVRWSAQDLRRKMDDLAVRVRRLTEGQSIQVEQVPQYGAYGLAGVVSARILKRRVVALNAWSAPDLLFDDTPGALRGVEVAGRSHRGAAGLRELAEEKATSLRKMSGIAEAWLSLWCTAPQVSVLLKVRP